MVAIENVRPIAVTTWWKTGNLHLFTWQWVHDGINYLCHVLCSVRCRNKSLGTRALRASGLVIYYGNVPHGHGITNTCISVLCQLMNLLCTLPNLFIMPSPEHWDDFAQTVHLLFRGRGLDMRLYECRCTWSSKGSVVVLYVLFWLCVQYSILLLRYTSELLLENYMLRGCFGRSSPSISSQH